MPTKTTSLFVGDIVQRDPRVWSKDGKARFKVMHVNASARIAMIVRVGQRLVKDEWTGQMTRPDPVRYQFNELVLVSR